jgi:outer membrane protein assembly factor BamB
MVSLSVPVPKRCAASPRRADSIADLASIARHGQAGRSTAEVGRMTYRTTKSCRRIVKTDMVPPLGARLPERRTLADPSGPTLKAGQGINIAPQVLDGKVFMSTSGQLTGGVAYALDAKTGKVLWSFHETKLPSERGLGGPLGAGGAWGTPVVDNGTVYFGVANPYRSVNDAITHPTKPLYNDSTVALDESPGKLD